MCNFYASIISFVAWLGMIVFVVQIEIRLEVGKEIWIMHPFDVVLFSKVGIGFYAYVALSKRALF